MVVLHGDGSGFAGQGGLSLDGDDGTLGLGLLLVLGVLLDALDEVLSRSRSGDVLDAEVDSLLDVAVVHLLVDDDADGGLGDVVDDTRLAVVDLVRHTILFPVSPRSSLAICSPKFAVFVIWNRFGRILDRIACLPLLNSTICLDINDVANPANCQYSFLLASNIRYRNILVLL